MSFQSFSFLAFLAGTVLVCLALARRSRPAAVAALELACVVFYVAGDGWRSLAVLAAGVNLLTCLIFYIASIIPSNAADYTALNGILGGTWFILLGSTVAFLASAALNNFLNWAIGSAFRKNPDGRAAFAARTDASITSAGVWPVPANLWAFAPKVLA